MTAYCTEWIMEWNLISEISLARDLETTYNEILSSIHPHPTLSEAIMEATADALDEAIHI